MTASGSMRSVTGAARRTTRWLVVAGARPNLVKLAPLVRAAAAVGERLDWVHTGQHAEHAMSEAIARDGALPPPRARLRAPRAGPRRVETMARRLAPLLHDLAPSLVVVLGDVDSTVAGALAARRVGLRLAHVEAGLRTFDLSLPEERNRLFVDRLSHRLYAPEPQAVHNLRAEGVVARCIRQPGNVMADALRLARAAIEERARSHAGPYVVATFHRQANVDPSARRARIVRALGRVAREFEVVWPLHPRARRRLGAEVRALRDAGVAIRPPLAYLDFLALVRGAAAVVTDSGGLQVEASLLSVPCLTVRPRTEHLLTLEQGTNRLVPDLRRLPTVVREVAGGTAARPRPGRPRAWDGRAAQRIVADWVRGLPGAGDRPDAPVGGTR